MSNEDEEVSREEITLVTAFLEGDEKYKADLEAQPYDGVRGLPPEWVPPPMIDRYRNARNRILDSWGYSPNEAVNWIDRYCRQGEEDNDWFFPAKYPCGLELEPGYFSETIGILANLRWAVSLGPKNGLKELAGDRASQGFSTHEASKLRRKDNLRVLMETTFRKLRSTLNRDPTNLEVIQNLKSDDEPNELHRVIDEINFESQKIFWRTQRDKEKTTSFVTFNDRMTRIRKNIPD